MSCPDPFLSEEFILLLSERATGRWLSPVAPLCDCLGSDNCLAKEHISFQWLNSGGVEGPGLLAVTQTWGFGRNAIRKWVTRMSGQGMWIGLSKW